MKSEKLGFARAVMIARDHWDVPVRVRLREYLQFCRRLDGQLKDLVARWDHLGTADGSSSRRRSR